MGDLKLLKKILENLIVYSVFASCLIIFITAMFTALIVSPIVLIWNLIKKLKGKKDVFWEVTRKTGSGSKYLPS